MEKKGLPWVCKVYQKSLILLKMKLNTFTHQNKIFFFYGQMMAVSLYISEPKSNSLLQQVGSVACYNKTVHLYRRLVKIEDACFV
jgi:hypothetical protein